MSAVSDLPVVAYRLSVAGEDPDYLESVGYDIHGNAQWAVRSKGIRPKLQTITVERRH